MKHLIWDLDGTLIDSDAELKKCIVLAVEKSGIDLSKQIRPFVIGPKIDEILRISFPIEVMSDAILKEVIFAFREIYDNSKFENTQPFPNIEKIISETKMFTHHIVTNKPDLSTKRILDKIGWLKYIASICTPYSTVSIKSKSELFSDVISEYSDRESVFIGIGDMKTDCTAARDNNIPALGVLWGSGTWEELHDCCDYLFETTTQLYNFLIS